MRDKWDIRSEIEKREDADSDARQSDRTRDSTKRVEDPLQDIGRKIESDAYKKTLLIAGNSTAVAVLFAMPSSMTFVSAPAVFGAMMLLMLLVIAPPTYSLQMRAKRYLAGKDDEYWIRMNSEIERYQNNEIWYELSNYKQAQRDANPSTIPLIYLIVIINIIMWIIAFK
jgi:hypothetical protein